MKQQFKIFALACMMVSAVQAQTNPSETDKKPVMKEASDPRLDWWREAKFGMFIHWGIYSALGRGEWVMNKEGIPLSKYAELATNFNPVKFNADEWVKAVKDAGMKYIVITAKHHDGFAMFDSKASPYNIMAATPFHRDPLKELAEACKKEGIKLCFYYSHAQDWYHPGGAIGHRTSWDPAQKGNFDKYQDDIAIPQVKELLSNYGPVGVIWFDTPIGMNDSRARKFTDLVHTMQPATLVNSRVVLPGYKSPTLTENQVPGLKKLGVDYLAHQDHFVPEKSVWSDWETCTTLNDHWGYAKDDNNWKSPEMLLREFIEVASKGGNYLLNVGPTSEGLIPAPSVERLAEVGKWMKVNGEAIHGSQPSPFGYEYGTSPENKSKNKNEQSASATGSLDWRCTSKPGKLYFFLLKWPGEKFSAKEFKGKASKAYLLADPDRNPLPLSQDNGELSVTLPAKAPGQLFNVLCVEL